MDYSLAFSQLKQSGILTDSDVFAVGQEAPSNTTAVLFGAIGSAIESSKKGHYIFIANEQRLVIVEVDKRSGTYIGVYAQIPKEHLKKISISTFLQKSIFVKTQEFDFRFVTAAKFRHYNQKEDVQKLFTFLKNNYKK